MLIDERVLELIRALNDAGHDAYLVGGCVRDSVRGSTPVDWDVATSATPDESKHALHAFTTHDTGLRHGTITAVCGGMPVEVTTFRVDGEYADHRRPNAVTFTRELADDLARRDFTINAMAYHPDRGLIDLHGGQADLQRRVIRAVGDADARLTEDALRILRALRFASQLDFRVEPSLADSIRRKCELLRMISAERVRSELCKLLLGAGVKRVTREFPEPLRVVLGAEPHAVEGERLEERVATLTLNTDADAILRRLRFSNADARSIRRVRSIMSDDGTAVELLLRYGDADAVRRSLRLRDALGEPVAATLAELDALLADGRCFTLARLAVDGGDAVRLGLSGKAVGNALQATLEAVAHGALPNERDSLLQALTQWQA
ncbi:MAG: hypothetical protein LBC65_00840 [Oscillospiraceae bacterium]|jgi:tRNA nucleotidyltransferase (CCA-adding enzyme)|nr:hypothetical protein [Oscillospiraceae bacterium]